MQTFSGKQYLLIDAANAYGLDKETYDVRLAWARENMNELEKFIPEADDSIMYAKAVLTIRAVQRGEETGHLVGLDATTSGIQFMSAMTGCERGATWTNLIDPSKRYDCYTEAFNSMMKELDGIECSITRKEAKSALMYAFYGSEAEPKSIFGEDSLELEEFHKMMARDLPGAYELMTELKAMWNPNALSHSWRLPCDSVITITTIEKKKAKIEVDELEHHKFTYEYKSNETKKKGVSLVACTVHSIDGYMARELQSRCNHNKEHLNAALRYVRKVLATRTDLPEEMNTDNVISIQILDKPSSEERRARINAMTTNDLIRLAGLIVDVLSKPSFEMVSVHDEFKCLANYCNEMRYYYKEIMAELAESDLLSQIFSDLSGKPEKYESVAGGLSKQEMAKYIRNSEYAIC